MLIVLSGPSAVGKSFCVDFLCSRYNFRTLVPFTSRPPRTTEAEGLQYHFRSREELRALSNNFSVGYWGTPLEDDYIYGYTSELDEIVARPHNYVIQCSAELASRIKQQHRAAHASRRLILAFLDFQDPHVLQQKLRERFGNGDFDKRLTHARREIGQRDAFDIVVAANEPFAMAHRLLGEIRRLYELELQDVLMPPTYGPMSDVDILNSTSEPDGLRFHNLTPDQLKEKVHGWSIDLTLGDRYWKVKPDTNVFDLATGTDSELDRRFERCRATIEKGIVLKPGEMILSVTHEHLQLPKSIAGIFAGRTSYANVGISIELSQILLQPGHNSPVRLQVRNHLPYATIIYPGMTLVQVVFFRLMSPASRAYIERVGAHYKTPDEVISKYYTDGALTAVRTNRQKPLVFPWAAAYEIAILATGTAAALAFLSRGLGQNEFGKYAEFAAALVGIPTLVATFFKFRQAGWR